MYLGFPGVRTASQPRSRCAGRTSPRRPISGTLLGPQVDKSANNRSRRAAVEPTHRMREVLWLGAILKQQRERSKTRPLLVQAFEIRVAHRVTFGGITTGAADFKGRKGLGQSAQREQGGQESVPHEQKTSAKQESRDGYYRCQCPKLQDCGDKPAMQWALRVQPATAVLDALTTSCTAVTGPGFSLRSVVGPVMSLIPPR